MTSRFYNDLLRRTTELADHMLPEENRLGTYTPQHLDMIRGYILLCHAAIETYLETWATELARKSCGVWKEHSIASLSLVGMVTHAGLEFPAVPSDLRKSKQKQPEPLRERVNTAVARYNSMIGNNHGMRSDHFYRLLIPLGMQHGDFDGLFMKDIDEFAQKRGLLAHTIGEIQDVLDPVVVKADVKRMLDNIVFIDEKLTEILNDIPAPPAP